MISLPVGAFLAADRQALVQQLAYEDMQQFRGSERTQIRAWEQSITVLAAALAGWPDATDWQLILEFPMRRLGRRIDALLIMPRAVVVLEFKTDAAQLLTADRQQVEDYALDLQDFHAACRAHPIIPVLVATHATPGPAAWPLLLPGVAATVIDASAATLGQVLRALAARLPPVPPQTPDRWADARYQPVPGIIEAARTLYLRHDVSDIVAARADVHNLTVTTDAILGAIRAAEAERRHTIIFVTGIPGAGKTLCGLNAVFGTAGRSGATFLTGNPTLVLVLREALARDASRNRSRQIGAARRETRSTIQALPHMRDHYVSHPLETPAEHVIVVDEAQRCWSGDYAVRATKTRPVQLTASEPAHILDIMARHGDWSTVVCLIGGGQEIHTGEGGLAEWSNALRDRPDWHIYAPPGLIEAPDPRQRLAALPNTDHDVALHLSVPVRSVRNPGAAAWVDHVLRSDAVGARRIAETGMRLPFVLTRDLDAMRHYLRQQARGLRRAGLVASSGAKRLRADGLGVEVPHMDAGAVANWFLDRWPDVRASDALETVATQFACQGLELDLVGLCWGGDLVRRQGWRVRNFSGSKWTVPGGAEAIANRMNTYRVLLTRARYETVIWVPRGDARDRTRDPAELDQVAACLLDCGAVPLETLAVADAPPPTAQATLV